MERKRYTVKIDALPLIVLAAFAWFYLSWWVSVYVRNERKAACTTWFVALLCGCGQVSFRYHGYDKVQTEPPTIIATR